MRLVSYFAVVLIGITIVFFIPRMLPSDPVNAYLGKLMGQAPNMDPEAVEKIRTMLTDTFGLQGSLFTQYTSFLKRLFISRDFGPSLSQYPVGVIQLILHALPWTLGLMLSSTIISWLIGNAIGLFVALRKDKLCSKILEAIAIVLYPIPFYICSLILIILFGSVFPIFPITTSIFAKGGFTWTYIKTVVYNSALPALSMIIVNIGWWLLSMRTLTSNTCEEDYVAFAKLKNMQERKIVMRYILPNVALPQVTMLALQLGLIFGGSLVCEMLFTYPGLGTLLYNAIQANDYNLIIGIISLSIVGVATATLVIDMMAPLIDPRVRLQ